MDIKEVGKFGIIPSPSLAVTSDTKYRLEQFSAQDRGVNVYTKGDTANVYPKKHYWCGFDITGRQKWYLELTNGRLVSSKDENYIFWLKKFSINEKKTLLERKTRRNEIPLTTAKK